MSFLSQDDVINDITKQLRGDGGVGDTSNVPTPVKDSEIQFKKDSKLMKKTLKKKQPKKGGNVGKKKSETKKKASVKKKDNKRISKKDQVMRSKKELKEKFFPLNTHIGIIFPIEFPRAY